MLSGGYWSIWGYWDKKSIDLFVDMSIQENKYVDPFDEYIGQFEDTRIENHDEIDKSLKGYFVSQLDEVFEKKDPEEFLNLLEQVLANPLSFSYHI